MYGGVGGLILLILWVYYSSMILLFGAEFTQTWALRKGSGITPKKGARRIVDETPGEQEYQQASQRGKGGGKRSHSAGKQSPSGPAAQAPAPARGHKKRKTPLLDARRREIAEKEARGEE